MKKALMQGLEDTLAEVIELGFSSAFTDSKSASFSFLEMALMYINSQRTLNSLLAKIFGQSLQSDALISAMVEQIGAQTPHPHAITIKGLSSVKFETVVSKDEHLVASFSSSETVSSFKAPDSDSVIFDRHKSRMAGKTAKRHFCRK